MLDGAKLGPRSTIWERGLRQRQAAKQTPVHSNLKLEDIVKQKIAVRKRAPRAPKPTWHVAVVVRRISRTTIEEINRAASEGIWLSNRNGSRGDWSAFLGTDRDKVIHHAQVAAEKWGYARRGELSAVYPIAREACDDREQRSRAGAAGVYEVWVGGLTGLVQVPTPKYDVRPITR